MSARNYQSPWRRTTSYGFLIFLALIFIVPFAHHRGHVVQDRARRHGQPALVDTAPAHALSLAANFRSRANASVTDFPRWFLNSVFVATAITLGRVFLDSLAGYALARLGFRGRKLVFGLVIATLAVPGVVLLIPRFLVLKELGLFNSYPGMILPMIVDATGIFLMRQFFLQVPVSLEEAGKVDGASIGRIWWSIVLPVVRPGLITLTILSFQGSWNEFQFFEIATISPKYYTLTTGLANIVGGGLSAGTQFPLKLGASALTILPIAVLFFVLQRYITPGRMSGAVKG